MFPTILFPTYHVGSDIHNHVSHQKWDPLKRRFHPTVRRRPKLTTQGNRGTSLDSQGVSRACPPSYLILTLPSHNQAYLQNIQMRRIRCITLFRGTNDILQNIPSFKPNMKNIPQNIVSPT